MSVSADSPVLVAGAGPVGLTAALMLAHYGTPVRVIDAADAPTDRSTAVVLWRRSLEVLDPVVPFVRFVADHPAVDGMRMQMADGRDIALDMPAIPHTIPAGTLVPQSTTERILLEALHDAGVDVERGTRLTGVTGDDDGVIARVEGPAGARELHTSWLLTCDGTDSTVHDALGVDFPGACDTRWLVADVELDGQDPGDRRVTIVPAQDGTVSLFPVGSSRWRVIADLGPGTPAMNGGACAADVQAVLDERTALGWKVTGSHGVTDARVDQRHARHYVHGRILLLGDAAHLQSPSGGRGLNIGIQDAANAAWKIALAHRRAAPDSLVAGYHDERHPVGADVGLRSARLLNVATPADLPARARNFPVPSDPSLAPVRNVMAAWMTDEAVTYRDGPLADGSGTRHGIRSGDPFPNVPVTFEGEQGPSCRMLRGPGATLVLLGRAAGAGGPDSFGGPGGLPITVRRVGAGADVEDHTGALAEALGIDNGAVLVRPDGAVASVGGHAADTTRWITTRLLEPVPG